MSIFKALKRIEEAKCELSNAVESLEDRDMFSVDIDELVKEMWRAIAVIHDELGESSRDCRDGGAVLR